MDDDDIPLASRVKVELATPEKAKVAPPAKKSKTANGAVPRPKPPADSDEDDIPLSKRKVAKKSEPAKAEPADTKKRKRDDAKVKNEVKSTPETSSQKKNGTPKKSQKKAKGATNGARAKTAESEGAENGDQADDEDDDEKQFKWWLDQNKGDDSEKWQTLEHNGVFFPPPYEPHGIKMRYNGKELTLKPEEEEVATFYAALVGTQWADNPIFQKNFFKDFRTVLGEKHVIQKLELCDFTPIMNYLADLKEKKKNMTKEDKEKLKAEKKQIEEKYGWCFLDSRKEKVGNFRIEPPGLFRGRGAHPKAGCLKKRVQPEDVTINIGKDAKIPEPPAGHKWGSVVHDNTVTWLANWTENVNGSSKYVFLAANSSLKGMSDYKKFERARELKNHVDKIRAEYTAELKVKEMAIRQRATAMYLIDKLALRAGNEKGEDEADTVGCCSLRVEHITLKDEGVVVFDFLGKDSIRYYNEVRVDKTVWKNLGIFMREPKTPSSNLFDRLSTTTLNKHLTSLMPGLTAKVFRTFNASFTFQQELDKANLEGATVQEKILAYNRANRQVAVLCNHQRTVSAAHGKTMMNMRNKLRALKYQRREIKQSIIKEEPKLKKQMPQLLEEESDLEEEWVQEHLKDLEAKEAEKLEKENKKREEKGEKPLTSLPKKVPGVDKLKEQLEKINERIIAARAQMVDKDENKTTALGTSKINYIDPRISAAWCYKHNVPLEKIFNRSLREKFQWALEVDKDWVF